MDRKSVNIGIRSVLNSSPNALTINQVWHDYLKLCGDPIPVRDLGFRTLHDYLRSIPDVVELENPDSPHSLVRAVSDEKSQHIANFVRSQKVSSVGRKTFSRPRFRGNSARRPPDFVPLTLQRRVLDHLALYSDGLNIHDFEEVVKGIQQKTETQASFDAILHKISPYVIISGDDICLTKQYMTQYKAENPPRRPNEEIIHSDDETSVAGSFENFLSDFSDNDDYVYTSPKRSADDARRGTPDCRSPCSDRGSLLGTSATRGLVSDTLIKNCYALLDENPNGIWLTQLAKKYEAKFGYSLDVQQHGFDCGLDLVTQLSDVFKVTQYEKSGDRILRDARKFPIGDDSSDLGELPKSVVNEIKKLLSKRSPHQIYTDELVYEYKECYKKTLDPTDYGFKNMDDLLRSLIENESSIFSIKQVRSRSVMYLKATSPKEENHVEEYDSDGALPKNCSFVVIPKEVCSYDFKLPINPILKMLQRGDRILVSMAEVYGPERFYLHFAEDIENLNAMMEDLHTFYENNHLEYELSHDTVRRGMLCACPFDQDSKWHRVNVITCRGTSDVKVRFFDYGTIREVAVNKLRYLHEEYAQSPAMSVRSKLGGIKLKQLDESQKEKQKEFSRLVGESFYYLANGASKLEAEILSVDLINQCLEVYLYATYENDVSKVIHEELIQDELVLKKEIDDVAEIPLPPGASPKSKVKQSTKPVVQEPASSTALPSATNVTTSAQNSDEKKNRPPPGIPIPPNLTTTDTSTQTASKPSFNGYTPPKVNPLNPLNPPFYPPTYTGPPLLQHGPPHPRYTAPHPAFGALPHFLYSQPPRMAPPMYQTYTPHMFEYNYGPMRPPTYAYPYAAQQSHPPPGFASEPLPQQFAPQPAPQHRPTGVNVTNRYANPNASRRPSPVSEKADKPKPEWISKLEVVRDLLLDASVPDESVKGKLSEIIDDFKHTPQNGVKERASVQATIDLTNDFEGLLRTERSSTPLSIPESTSRAPVTPTKSESEYSFRSESRMSTKDEARNEKIEQLKMFVKLHNPNVKKT